MPISKRDHNKIIDQQQLIFQNPVMEKKVLLLRKKWKININLHPDVLYDVQKSLTENDLFNEDVDKIMNEFKLSAHWLFAMWEYIFAGELFLDSEFIDGDAIYFEVDDNHAKASSVTLVNLSINSRTTINDVKKAWPEIQRLFKNQKQKQYTSKITKLGRFIYDSAKRGQTIPMIAKAININFDEDLDYGYIKKLLSSYQTKYKIKKNERISLRSK